MNSRSWILLAGTFACGFLCAWLVKPGESPPTPEETSAKRESRSPRSMTLPRRESSAMQRANARIAALLDDGESWEPRPDQDYPSLLAALERRAGLTGPDYGFQPLLRKIVHDWYDSDPDQAVSWVLSIDNVKDRKELMQLIVYRSARDDWRGAVELAALYGATDGAKIQMPEQVSTEIGKLAPAEFARISQLFASSWDRSYAFGNDFQFRETLELLDSDYRHPSILKEWSRRDFASAWEWSYENINSPKQLSDMVEAWGKKVGNDEVAEFAASLMDESHWDPEVAKRRNWGREQWQIEHMQIVRDMLMSRPSPDMFQSVLERVSNRQESLNELLRANLHLNVASARRYREELLNQMTADERMTAFQSIDPDLIRRDNIRQNFEGALTLLGHSAEEIDWMLPAPAPEDSTQAPESNEPAQDPFD